MIIINVLIGLVWGSLIGGIGRYVRRSERGWEIER